MKSSKQSASSSPNKNACKKSSKKESSSKLDRKSSRGMIYENEELRLRTININAEVERGQSDIRKLRRENEQLRREIWSLRDEYDRLNKRFKASKYLPDSISEHGQSESNSEESDSCDTCREESNISDYCDQYPTVQEQYDHCLVDALITYRNDSLSNDGAVSTEIDSQENSGVARSRDHLHVNFDHLSIVSEENLSTSDGNIAQPVEYNPQNEQQGLNEHNDYNADINSYGADGTHIATMMLPSLIGPLTPVTPIEMVANQLNDLQSTVPSLTYFENVVHHHMGSSISSSTSTNTGETVIQPNGWDYKIQSPFMQRQCQASDPSSSNSTSTTMSPSHLSSQISPQQANNNTFKDSSMNTNINSLGIAHRSPKHFFSPIKPRLKLDTALSKPVSAASSMVPYSENVYQNCDSPDIYINNVLAAPYYPQPIAVLSLPSVILTPGQQSFSEPIYVTAQKKTQCSEQNQITDYNSKNSVNIDQILTELGMISEDILHMQLKKSKSQEKFNVTDSNSFHQCASTKNIDVKTSPLHTATTHTQTLTSICSPKCQNVPTDKNRKPYRSEMNLVLSYNGSNPVIIPLAKNIATNDAAQVLLVDEVISEREGNSPSPSELPTPMAPFPTNLMYLGFDRLKKPHETEMAQLAISTPPSPPPPQNALPLSTSFPFSLSPQPSKILKSDTSDDTNVTKKGDHKPPSLVLATNSADIPSTGNNITVVAPVKRKTFAKQYDGEMGLDITRTLDISDSVSIKGDIKVNETIKDKHALEAGINEISSYESSSGSEVNKQKSLRRVSIACRDPVEALILKPFDQHQQQQVQISSTSDDRLDDVMPSLVVNVKHAHSTPNSPHSSRRRGGNTNLALSTNSGNSTLHHHGHHHHHHHHQHSRKLSQESINEARCTNTANNFVNSNPDNVLGATQQHGARYKCSRRHSEGTVSSTAGDRGGGGTGSATGVRISGTSSQHHHHHNHNQDSNQETGTSVSERNSASLVSSRESSTSLSMRSQRRKISVSSHTGGKIPWCGCWGNGCL